MNQSHQTSSGKTAGENTQSQGGIRHSEAEEARTNFDPASGGQGGHLGVDLPGPSLDEGGDELNVGLTGDDGGHVSATTASAPADLEPWQAAKTAEPDEGRTDINIGSRDQTDRPPTDDLGNDAPSSTSEGGQGGVSGTGDSRPHRGRESGEDALEHDEAAGERTGPTYQSGGTAVDRSQKVAERKAQEGTAGPPADAAGGPGTSPGTPLGKDRTP